MVEFHPLRGEAASPESVCGNYEVLLDRRPPDLAIIGIGEDGEWGRPRLAGEGLTGRMVLTEEAIVATRATVRGCEVFLAIESLRDKGGDGRQGFRG